MVAITAANLTADRIAAAIGRRRAILAGALLVAASCAGLLGVDGGTGYGAIVVPITLLGFGAGVIIPIITAELLGSAPSSRSGVAAGTLNTLRQTGSAIGVALFGSLIAGHLVVGLHAALAVSIALLLAVSTLAVTLLERS
jgi:DHA2 family methylenomycin A resistance protein-like MFS transporter